MARSTDRVVVALACAVCEQRDYHLEKSGQNDPERPTLQEPCPRCRRRTEHRETR